MIIIKILKRGINIDANPVPQSRLLKEIHSYNCDKFGAELNSFSESQSVEIYNYWKAFTLDFDIRWIQFYFSKVGKFDVRYIPHDLYYSEIDRVLNSPYRAVGLDDKRLYPKLFSKVKQPKILISKIGNILLDENGNILQEEKVIDDSLYNLKVVCKEPVNSCGGHSVECLFLPRDSNKLIELLRGNKDIIVQECLTQHKSLEEFHPESINTIRIITYLRENGEIVILSSVLRMGNDGSFVDNVSSGGCTCGIGDDGKLHDIGFSNDMKPIDRHPKGIIFAGRQIPFYDRIKQMVKELHREFPYFALLAWDCTVDEKGIPILIEVNMNNASIDFMQLNNGPLFGNYTTEILTRVYRNTLMRV